MPELIERETSLVRDDALRLAAARSGDQAEFALLTEPHRRELEVYCYRMFGSLQDAEDLVQETLLRAWRRLDTYAGRASLRAWLYKIATNACLDALRQRPRRILPPDREPAAAPGRPPAAPLREAIWLEPFPDDLLASEDSSPEARYDRHESITLAFLAALQTLPPRQRAVLILRDVLDWHAAEVAELLELTVPAVHSAVHRARTTLAARYHIRREHESPGFGLDAGRTHALLERYVAAWEKADVDGIVALLKEDATYPMPPSPSWYQGKTAIRAFIAGTLLAGDDRRLWHLRPIRANGGPAVAWYRRNQAGRGYEAFAIQVLTLDGDLLADVTTFVMPALFPHFGLPLELAG